MISVAAIIPLGVIAIAASMPLTDTGSVDNVFVEVKNTSDETVHLYFSTTPFDNTEELSIDDFQQMDPVSNEFTVHGDTGRFSGRLNGCDILNFYSAVLVREPSGNSPLLVEETEVLFEWPSDSCFDEGTTRTEWDGAQLSVRSRPSGFWDFVVGFLPWLLLAPPVVGFVLDRRALQQHRAVMRMERKSRR